MNLSYNNLDIPIRYIVPIHGFKIYTKLCQSTLHLSGHVPEIQAEVEVVKIKNPDFSCWA